MNRFTSFLLLCCLPGLAHAGRKSKEDKASKGMMMPDLSKVLGEAWDAPPELSDRAQPGAVLEVTDAGYRRLLQGCVSAKPMETSLTNVSMQNTLSGGVGWGVAGAGGKSSASHGMKLSFQGPLVVGFDLIDFVPSKECVKKIMAYHSRGGEVSQLVVVQEALMARVSGCEQTAVSGDVSGAGGQGSFSTTGACQMFSDVPVAVGIKAVPISSFPEFAALGGSTKPAATNRSSSSSSSSSAPSATESEFPATPAGGYPRKQPLMNWAETPVVKRCPHTMMSSALIKKAVSFWQREGFDITYSDEVLPAEVCEQGYERGTIIVSGEDELDATLYDSKSKQWIDPNDDSVIYSYKIRIAHDATEKLDTILFAIGCTFNLMISEDPDSIMYGGG